MPNVVRGHNLTLVDAQSLAAAWTSDIVDTAGCLLGSLEYHITNDTHVGTLTLLGGNIPDSTLMQPRNYISKTAANIANGQLAVTAGSAFDNLIQLLQATERYYCLQYTTAPTGTGLITVYTCFKNRAV